MYYCRVRILQLLIASMICLACSVTSAIDETVKSTLRKKGTAEASVTLDGIVTNLVTGSPISGVTINIAGKRGITDVSGVYSIVGLEPGTSRMELTGSAIVTRSLVVRHQNSGSIDVSVKAENFNNAMFWASTGRRGRIMRWQKPPKWVIYSHVLDSHPPKLFPRKDMAYLLRTIKKELPRISSFFCKPDVEVFFGRPNDDPRWTGKKLANGYILCAPTSKGGGLANWKAWESPRGPYVRYAKIRNNFKRAPKVWRHEIAHALGMCHAYDNKKWLPLGAKDRNYRRTKLHDGVEYYTAWDKLWLHCVYSGDRPAGNTPPDRDPNDYTHFPLDANNK